MIDRPRRTPREVFESVSRCQNARLCLESSQPHSCREIVTSQGLTTYNAFQLPEPWIGLIDVAPILFVASNPSISSVSPVLGGSDDETVWESHHYAYGGGERAYIDGIHPVAADGTPAKPVPYWSAIRARAQELIPVRSILPGRDYALTEIVHCKSTGEIGVSDAADTCARMHMNAIMSVAAARVVVAVGKIARAWFLRACGKDPAISPVACELGNRVRLVVYLPHPAGYNGGRKTFAGRYSAANLQHMRDQLQ